MRLNVFDCDDFGINVASVASSDYMNLLYKFDKPIIDILMETTKLFEKEIIEDIEVISEDDLFNDLEKEYYFNQLNIIKSKLNGSVFELLKCFDKIEISIADINLLENIDKVIKDINIPIVLNVKEIPEDYLINNLGRIDLMIKEKFGYEVRYLINQCLGNADAHYEDNSYELEDVILVLTSIRKITNTIKQFNLSPFEQVMYIYDMVKDRSYIEADKNDSYLESRDVLRILKSDKIVCLGFASLFKSLLDNLNIKNETIFLDSVSDLLPGHARNLVYINDPKYNLNHIMYFDATWDSKRNIDGIIDEDRYDNFAREKLYFLIKDDKKLKEDKYLPYFLRKDNDYSFIYKEIARNLVQIKRLFNMIDWEEYFANIEISFENFNKVLYLMGDDLKAPLFLGQDYDFCEFMYKECCKMLNRKVSNDDFLRCLYTVRRVENYLDPNKYNFDINELFDVFYNRALPEISNEKRLFFREFMGYDKMLENKLNEFDEFDKNTSRYKFLNVLSTLNNNINTLEIDSDTSISEVIKLLKK